MLIEKKREYAQAIYSLAEEEKNIEKYLEISLAIIDIFNSNKEINIFLSSSSVEQDKKKNLVKELSNDFSTYKNWLFIIIDSGNSRFIKDYVSEYINIYNINHNITKGIAWTAKNIEREKIDRLEVAASAKIKKKVMIENKIDKGLIGGIKLQIGDDIWDNSIKNKLEQLLNRGTE